MDRLKEIYDYVLHPKEELYYVEKDIRAFFLPLHIPHIVMFQSKYRTRGSFISKNRHAYNFIALLLYISIIVVICLGIYMEFLKILTFSVFLIIFLILQAVSIIVLFFNNVFNSVNNLMFVVKLQAARRSFLNCKPSLRPLVIKNWIIFSGLTILYIVTDIIIITVYSFVYVILMDLVLIGFDFMIVYAIRGMTLLRHSVVCWIEESKVRNSLNSSDAEEFAVNSVDLKEMFEAYCDLADAFLSYKNVFAVPVSTMKYGFFVGQLHHTLSV